MVDTSINSVIGNVWDKKTLVRGRALGNWWQHKLVTQHIGKKVCGSFTEYIKAQSGARVYERAVSLGCGTGAKEMRLLEAGVVKKFDLFELSKERIQVGEKLARSKGLEARMNFQLADAFVTKRDESEYDMVHWNNSLHHMLDTGAAIDWSHHVLRKGGAFVMDDFVGPSRFQWSDLNITMASRFRRSLPHRLLERDGSRPIGTRIVRKTIEEMIALDPSEAADSGNILHHLVRVFPKASVVPTGGAIYHLGLAGIYANMDMTNEEDVGFLRMGLLLDDVLIQLGETHYCVAVAFK